MRIAFYINTLQQGGAQRAISVLANSFARRGNDVMMITSFPTKDDYQLDDGVERVTLDSHERKESFVSRNFHRVLSLRRILKEKRLDALVSFMAEPNMRSLIAAAGTSIPVVVSVRNDPRQEYKGAVLTFLAKRMFSRARWTVFQTEEARRFFPDRVQSRSSVIFNPVEDSFFETEYAPDKGVVVTCGRLVEQKNHEVLIEAFGKVVLTHPEAKLEIYGEGPFYDRLEEQIRSQALSSSVFLKGRTVDVASALSHAAVFVLSSKYEGMPNALMEALAVGVPSVSTDCPCGGPRLLVENGVNGLLVTDSVDAIAEAIVFLLDSDLERERLSFMARQKAQRYRAMRIAEEWERVILSCLEEKR